MGINDYLKIEGVVNFLQTIEKEKFTQFTINFIDSWSYKDEEKKETLKKYISVLQYEVNNILEIMNPSISDYQFFTELKQIING